MRLISGELKSRLAAVLEDFPDIAASLSLFSDYLNGPADRPVGVAVSGGGDSVALLLLLWLWGQRPLEVFTVDHGIHPLSTGWTRDVEALGRTIGLPVTVLRWSGDKPKAGLQAAARRARHHLILEAARAKGIGVLCLGHNADDVTESAAMRAEGSTVGAPKRWSPAPFWPQGEGMFYLRPLLGIGRGRLREWLTAAGVAYVDDPANANPAYLRARVRQQGIAPSVAVYRRDTSPANAGEEDVSLLPCERSETGEGAGEVPPEGAYVYVPTLPSSDILSALIVCAGGGEKLPRQSEIERIIDGAREGRTRFTLCGARVETVGEGWLICREPGDMTRNGAHPSRICDIWDGRFRLPAYALCGDIVPAKGHMSRLSPEDQTRIRALPPAVRAALPLLKQGDAVRLFAAGELQDVTRNRLRAALGLIRNEAEAIDP